MNPRLGVSPVFTLFPSESKAGARKRGHEKISKEAILLCSEVVGNEEIGYGMDLPFGEPVDVTQVINIRRRKVEVPTMTTRNVFPPTRLLPLKPTTIIAELPKPAVTGRKETREEMLDRKFQEIIRGDRTLSFKELPQPTVAKYQSNGVKKRTQDWAEGTLESKQ